MSDKKSTMAGGVCDGDSDKTVFLEDSSSQQPSDPQPELDQDKTVFLSADPVDGPPAQPAKTLADLPSDESEAQAPLMAAPQSAVVDSDKTQILHASSDDDSRTVMLGGSVNATQMLADVQSKTQMMGSNVTLSDSLSPGQLNTGQVDSDGKTVIKDRFVLESLLGSGGMGAVYKAKDLRKVEAKDRDPWVAVKVLNESFKNHPSAFISLQRETRKSQTLAHPNIVQVFDFDRDGDMVFMTMEILSGASFEDVIKENPEGLELEQVLSLTRDMGEALAHAHKHRITHADFKPGNVFLTDKGTAKVIDFGIARAVSSVETDQKDDKTVFDPNSLGALTPAYASLEMLIGEEPVPSDDVFALGCIIYELITGLHPFAKKPADQVAIAKLRPKRIKSLNRRQWKALQHSLALKRVNRYSSVEDFLNDFVPIVNPWRRPVVLAGSLVIMLAAFGGYRAYESNLKEQQLQQEKQVMAERQAQQDEQLRIQSEIKKVGSQLDDDFAGLNNEAADLQSLLDKRYLSFSTGALWRRQTKAVTSKLLSVYSNDDWRKQGRENDLSQYEGFKAMLSEHALKRQQTKQTLVNWARNYNFKLSDAYLAGAVDASNNRAFEDAKSFLSIAAMLNSESAQLKNVRQQISSQYDDYQALLAKEIARKEQNRIEAERKRQQTEFNFSLAALESSANNCQSGLLREGRGGKFGTDISKLSSGYQLLQRRFMVFSEPVASSKAAAVETLKACIQVYGYGQTEDARQRVILAAEEFPSYASDFQNLSIHPWNSCKSSFAGKGKRYSCRDRFVSTPEVRGPELVVIPQGPEITSFAISKFEITESEFDLFCSRSNSCEVSGKSANTPVTSRSLDELKSYTSWLSIRTGFAYALPSYDQWLYAAGGKNSTVDTGRNCTLKARGISKGDVLLPVDMGASNRWGLVNHIGNAREIVQQKSGWAAAGADHSQAMEQCTLDRLEPVDAQGDSVTGFRVVKVLPKQ